MIKNILKSNSLKIAPIFFIIGWILFVLYFFIEAKGLREGFSEELDISGKQRMLTQRILLEAYKLHLHDENASRSVILNSYTELRTNIYFLHENYFTHDKELKGIKTETEKFLGIVERFMESHTKENFNELELNTEIMFKRAMEVTAIIKNKFVIKQKNLVFFNIFFIVLNIIITFLFFYYIFFPTVKFATKKEEELIKLNSELEQKIEQKTHDLQESYEYTSSLLQASEEAQVVINNSFIIMDYSINTKIIFKQIAKNMEFNTLFEDVEQKEDLYSFVDFGAKYSENVKEEKVFFYHKKYYKMKYKMLNLSTFIISFYDITHQIQDLKRRDTIYNSQKAIVVVTDGKNIKNINSIFFEEFGFANLSDFKSKHNCICELFRQKNGYHCLSMSVDGMMWNKYMQQDSTKSYHVMMINKDGIEKIYDVKTSGNLFEDEDEEVIVFNDITELEEKNRILVVQSKDAAIGEMMSMIAHQWRQPLSVQSAVLSRIRVMHEMEMLDDKVIADALDKLYAQINYMSKTIDDFRDFFKDSDIFESVEVKDIVYSAKNLVDAILNTKSISFEVNFRVDESMRVMTILSKISQVFLNLYKNAIDQIVEKNIENGEVKVDVYTKDDELVIEVCDNALGIDEKIIDKIFEPYFSTKSKNGTGLGLYMSKKIIEELLEGRISVKNSDNGACFAIFLKIKDDNLA